MTSSWVDIPTGSGFTMACLPYGTFLHPTEGDRRLGVAIGEHVLDITAVGAAGVPLPDGAAGARSAGDVLTLERAQWRGLRARIFELLEESSAEKDTVLPHLRRRDEVVMVLPFDVADYVDFYSSVHHATNLGRLMRPGQEPLLPNWRHLPIGYHGRSSTVVVSGTPIIRPNGQTKAPADAAPSFGPCQMLDFELEVGFVTGGAATAIGGPVAIDEAEDRIYGMVLVNDWSARDIQAWEYQPLGPFLAKSFATSISPWVVPLEALEPHRPPAPPQDPEPLPHLRERSRRGVDIDLAVDLNGTRITTTTFADMYWTMAQQLAHMSSNGSVIRPCDLYASGTVSGPEEGSQGSLIELTKRGAEPITLEDGSQRSFLEDGDVIIMSGSSGSGEDLVGFGSVVGTVLPAPTTS